MPDDFFKDTNDKTDTSDDDLFGKIEAGSDLRNVHPDKPATAEDLIDKDAMEENQHPDLLSTDHTGIVPNSGLLKEGTKQVEPDKVADLQRSEEIEADLVREHGRFLEGSDNAKIGVTIDGRLSTDVMNESPMDFAEQPAGFISDGVNTFDDQHIIYDPGASAQKLEDVTPVNIEDRNDPRHPSFMGCVNSACQYRSTCLRYRMKNKVQNAFPFFPEECRIDGTYISLDDTDFTAYDAIEAIESNVTPTL